MIAIASDSTTLPGGWTMTIVEVSAGVYSVVARDSKGRTISSSGTDPEALVEECRADIQRLVSDPINPGSE